VGGGCALEAPPNRCEGLGQFSSLPIEAPFPHFTLVNIFVFLRRGALPSSYIRLAQRVHKEGLDYPIQSLLIAPAHP
jgi:hypothetical protein